jgi:hypothetical protein
MPLPEGAGRPHPSVVLLAYYYPPLAGVASERAAAFRRHLRRLGWQPVVVTARDGFYHRAADLSVDEDDVVRTANPELSRFLRKMYRGGGDATENRAVTHAGSGTIVTPTVTGRIGSQARRLVRDWLYIPDAQIGWVPFAASAAMNVLAHHDRAVLYSTSVPFSAHLAALGAWRRTRRPWIAEFRDPWSTSVSPMRSPNGLRTRFDCQLERLIVMRADHVVVTSRSTREEILTAHPGLDPARVSVITNGFEPIAERAVPSPEAPLLLLYAGTVAAGEDTRPVLSALDAVHARHPGCLRLRVLGPSEPWQHGHGERPWLEFGGVVTPAQAREAMAESSALLLLQGHPAYRNVIPGKLFEYVGARRPIVAICPQGAEMEQVLHAHADVRVVRRSRQSDLTAVVEQLLREHQSGEIQRPMVSLSAVAPLRRETQFARLADILARVLGA